MTLFTDVHDINGRDSASDGAAAHEVDPATQNAHRVNHLGYWVDDQAGKIFHLVEAPDREAANTVHHDGRGLAADEIDPVTEHAQHRADHHAMPATTHVAITVRDLAASETWYTRLLGVEPLLDEATGPFRHIVYKLGPTLLGLHGLSDLVPVNPFEELEPGLDHVAFGVADRAELIAWADHLDDLGIAHGDIFDPAYGSGLSFRDPDNIALDLFAPPS